MSNRIYSKQTRPIDPADLRRVILFLFVYGICVTLLAMYEGYRAYTAHNEVKAAQAQQVQCTDLKLALERSCQDLASRCIGSNGEFPPPRKHKTTDTMPMDDDGAHHQLYWR